MDTELIHKIFNLSGHDFEALALEVFQFQYQHNAIYRQFVEALQVNPSSIVHYTQIPFLPVGFFKTHPVVTTDFEPEIIFESSGTTGSFNSRHLVKSLDLYKESFTTAFEQFYGPAKDWCIIGLLPAYLERQHSSLVVMADELVKQSAHPQSGFYLYEHEKLAQTLQELEKQQQKTLLIGVTFALLDFAEKYPMQLNHTIVMETGGMKGRREEMTRQEVHSFLKKQWQLPAIHSEYGMTELLSQAYSSDAGIFGCPPWMRVVLREEDDPLHIMEAPATKPINGVVNIIDLANIYSCSFLATDDVGKLHTDGRFEVLGRLDSSDIRGCSLMVL